MNNDNLFDVPVIKEFRGETRWLSNFETSLVFLDGLSYPTVEHAYQAAKFQSPEDRAMIWAETTPGRAKRKAYDLKDRWNKDVEWDNIKIAVMLDLIRQKFAREPFRAKLLATGNAVLVEGNTWGDKFWGKDLETGEGLNWLGRLTMQVREELRQDRPEPDTTIPYFTSGRFIDPDPSPI